MVRKQDVLEIAARQYRDADTEVPPETAHTAVLVVDMTEEFVRPGQGPGIRRRIDAARAVGAQIVHRAYDVAPGLHGLNFRATEFAVPTGSLAGAPGAPPGLFGPVAFGHELEPAAEDVVVLKHCYSGFHETPRDGGLRKAAPRPWRSPAR